MSQYLSLLPFLALVFAAAASGALYMPGPWYSALNKPWWTPPAWVFPVVWTILYTMIAIAGWLAWKAEGIGSALLVWGIGLIVNGLWSYLMFGRQNIFAALIDVIALWFATAAFIWMVSDVSPGAAELFLPYLVWVTIAGTLNFQVWRMNG